MGVKEEPTVLYGPSSFQQQVDSRLNIVDALGGLGLLPEALMFFLDLVHRECGRPLANCGERYSCSPRDLETREHK